MKKSFFFLLLLVLSLALLSSCNTGSDESGTGTDLEIRENVSYYTQDDGTYLAVVSGKSEITSFHITATRNDIPITEVCIENNVTRIPSDALLDCIYLKSLTVGKDTTLIEGGAFAALSNLESLTFYPLENNLSYYFSSGGSDAASVFPSSFGQVRIAEGAEKITASVFKDCRTLTSIIIPDTVTEIEASAFENCKSLTAIELPSSLRDIDIDAFRGCDSLQYNEYEGGLYLGNKDNPYLALARAKDTYVTEFEIHGTAKFILDRAFEGCTYLDRITIPEGVTSIGTTAFEGCTGITIYCEGSFRFPDYWRGDAPVIQNCRTNIYSDDGFFYERIDGIKYAFNGHEAWVARQPNGITEARIANSIKLNGVTCGVVGIEDYAFRDCTTLTSVIFPSSVTYVEIGTGTFTGCTALTDITLPENLKRISNNAFEGCEDLTGIIIPKGVPAIEKSVFAGCKSLTSLTLPEGLTHVYDHAFDGCESLASLSLPETLTNVACGAFDGCQSLPLTEYKGALYLGSAANPYLCLVRAVDTEINVCTVNDAARIIQGGAFDGCSALTSVTVSASVEGIGDYAFRGCENLKSIIIPKGVIYFGIYAFESCDSLDKIYCEATYKPYAWAENWNVSGSSRIMTIWGYRAY